MGTSFANGDKPQNRVTISRGGDVPARKVEPESTKTDRSFAQPSPSAKNVEADPKASASEQDKVKALENNSKLDRSYSIDVFESIDDSEEATD